ncbi:hypothetical protein R8G61_12910 [Tenacibaculum maritimum]
MRKCKVCETDISHKRKHAKYCSSYCSHKATINRQKQNVKFENSYTQKYNFAIKLGFTSVAGAIGNLGKNAFNEKFIQSCKIIE